MRKSSGCSPAAAAASGLKVSPFLHQAAVSEGAHMCGAAEGASASVPTAEPMSAPASCPKGQNSAMTRTARIPFFLRANGMLVGSRAGRNAVLSSSRSVRKADPGTRAHPSRRRAAHSPNPFPFAQHAPLTGMNPHAIDPERQQLLSASPLHLQPAVAASDLAAARSVRSG